MSPLALADPPAAPTTPPRPRLTVRELQLALADARRRASVTASSGSDGDGKPVAPAHAHGSAADHDPDETFPATASPDDDRPSAPGDAAAADPDSGESWVPAHDGPVSLTAATAPRTRTARRATTARLDKATRRGAPPQPRHPGKTATLARELSTAAAAAPPRIVVVPACGGAGATTTAVLLAAALAPVAGSILLAAGADRGRLALRCSADGGDLGVLAAWARAHPGQPLRPDTPGLAVGSCGQGQLLVAADPRRPHGQLPDSAAALFPAAAAAAAAVVLDWTTPQPVPGAVWTSATHAVVVAPTSTPGLLDAEYTVDQLTGHLPEQARLSLLTTNLRARPPRRGGRAALARLSALRIPVTAVPYDRTLADEPRVHWLSLRARTRAAVFTALTHVLHQEDTP